MQALWIISSPCVNSNWRYGSQIAQTGAKLVLTFMTLTFDLWSSFCKDITFVNGNNSWKFEKSVDIFDNLCIVQVEVELLSHLLWIMARRQSWFNVFTDVVMCLQRNKYCKTSSINRTKSPKPHGSRLVLQLSLLDPLTSEAESRMKMLLEKHRQAMLQLRLSDQQVNFY